MSYVESRVWYDRAAVIPGRSNTRSKAPGRLFDIERGPLYVRASTGAYVRDVDGNDYIDMICGLGAISLGYGQFWPSEGGVYSLPHYAEVEAAEAVLQHVAPWASQVRFVRTGSEALTGAVMMARKATGRRLIFVAEGCYDDKTDILTKDGWKRFAEVKVCDLVATLNPVSHELEFQPVEQTTCYHIDDDLVTFTGGSIDLAITKDHKIYRRFRQRDDSLDWKFVRASECRGRITMMRGLASPWQKNTIDEITIPQCDVAEIVQSRRRFKSKTTSKMVTKFNARLFAEFLGYFIAEGYRLRRSNRKAYQVDICQNPGDLADRIREVVECLGFTCNGDRKKRRISFNSKELWSWLERCGDGAANKRIPREALEWPSELLHVLLDALIAGDGTRSESGQTRYYTTSIGLADDVQELAIKLGLCATIACRENNGGSTILGKTVRSRRPIATVSILKTITTSCQTVGRRRYIGNVYCVGVRNHLLLVRRNGKPAWSGNSYHGWHPWTSQRGEPGTDGADTHVYHYGDVQDVIRLATILDLPAAIVVEPARWEVTPPGYLFALQAVARHLGAFFIVDEMIYGGRWALGGACDVNRLTPDLACYGKAFGNGAPVAFIVGTDALARHGELISGTYSGDVGAARAVVETVGVYTSTPVINTLWARGKQLWEGVSEAVQTTGWVGRAFCDGVAPVHGRLRFADAAGVISPDLAKTFAGQMAKRGVLWHPDLVNIMAAHTVEQMALVVAATGQSLAEMAPPR